MRYYVYVSGAKVEMLHAQIPQKLLSRLTAKAKVDLKVAGVSVQRPASQDAGLYERLDVVEDFLEREYDVGWMSSGAEEEPGSGFWFRGEAGLPLPGRGNGRRCASCGGRRRRRPGTTKAPPRPDGVGQGGAARGPGVRSLPGRYGWWLDLDRRGRGRSGHVVRALAQAEGADQRGPERGDERHGQGRLVAVEEFTG
ncbi:hypothetical protein SUDANB180_06426 [Streptomyces sp. enrichment culture]